MRENRTSGSESGGWKRDKGAGLRPKAKAMESPPDPTVNAPVLDSTQRPLFASASGPIPNFAKGSPGYGYPVCHDSHLTPPESLSFAGHAVIS